MQIPTDQQVPDGTLPESPVAAQLRRGFRWLRFSPELENAYWTDWYAEWRAYLRVNLCIAIVVFLGFAQLSHQVMPADSQPAMNLVRFGALIPALVLALTVTFLKDGRRWYQPAILVLAPLGMGAIVVLVIIAWTYGEPRVFPALILAMISVYLLIGLPFFGAVSTNLLALAVYIYGAGAAGAALREFGYNALVLVAANVIGGAVAYNVERTRRREWLEARLLLELVERDGLTGIANRRRFDRDLKLQWARSAREQRPIALLMADIDCFKAYNDHYGHQAGDEALQAVARVLAGCARRPADSSARYGGEEFAMILPETSPDGARQVAERLVDGVRALGIPHEHSPAATVLTVSVGIGHVVPAPRRSAAGLVQLADQALYAAKDAGRNRVHLLATEYEHLQTGYFRRPTGGSRDTQ
ncbi:MAG: GGDEF domain-containing protein [Gammaproteobacteria bacterium]|nr:GGDEF domain-containing protein [Gammaproteobacteria bacterium]